MKKYYFFGMAALAILATACSNDDTVTVYDNARQGIGFSTFVDKSTRAASDVETGTLLAFNAYGYYGSSSLTKVFDKQEVTRTDASSNWSYDPKAYWIASENYYFAGIAPTNATLESITFPTSAGNDWTIAYNNETNTGTKDLVYGKTDTPMTWTSGTTPNTVDLTFKHLLSRVAFQFTNGGNNTMKLKITDLKITGATKSNTYNGSWGTSSTGTFDLGFPAQTVAGNNNGDATGNVGLTDVRYMIPGQQTLSVSFKAQMVSNDDSETAITTATDKTASVTLTEAMQMGYTYILKATITYKTIVDDAQEIVFGTTTVEEWNNSSESGAMTVN